VDQMITRSALLALLLAQPPLADEPTEHTRTAAQSEPTNGP
jgi:hypothetical protein